MVAWSWIEVGVFFAQASEQTLPGPLRATLLMALLGIALIGIFLVVSTMLGAHWVRRWGESRRGPAVPKDVSPLRSGASLRIRNDAAKNLPEEAIETVISEENFPDDDTITPR